VVRCVWEAEGRADTRAGGQVSLQSPLVSLPPRRPPPGAAANRGPVRSQNMDRRAGVDPVSGGGTEAAALVGRRRSTAHEDDAAAVQRTVPRCN